MKENQQADFIYRKYATLHTGAGLGDLRRYATQARDFQWRLRKMLPVDKNVPCLDIACGAGEFLHYLQKQGFSNITGLDVSPEQILLAKQVCENVFEARAEDFLKGKRGFGLITIFSFIEHLDNDAGFELLKCARNSLASGGRIILITPNADSPFASHMRYGDLTHRTIYNFSSVTTLFKACGFGGIVVRECGPVPHGLVSGTRWLLWQCIKALLKSYRIIEGGSARNWIFTTELIVAADKQQCDLAITSVQGKQE